MANANEPGCFKCHSDKRGPFTFEHARPVKLTGLTARYVLNPRVSFLGLVANGWNVESDNNSGKTGGLKVQLFAASNGWNLLSTLVQLIWLPSRSLLMEIVASSFTSRRPLPSSTAVQN